MVHGRPGFMFLSKEFLAGLAPDQQLEIFEMPGIRNQGEILTSVTEIAAHYLARLKATYPEGPILLGGACTGCLIAVEMAAQLADAGRPAHQLLLLDPSAPDNVRRYVERSAGVEKEHWYPALRRWPRRLLSLLLLGRASDGAEEADFDDERLRRLRVLVYRLIVADEERRRWKADRRRDGIVVSERAKATLLVAYCHYKPRPYSGNVDIISSKNRRGRFVPDKNLWGILLPKRRIHAATKRHLELFGTQAGKTAAMLQLCIDRAIEKVPTAPLEHA
jgi:thioesterase domain-containing protein